jgi:hypothetical protein
MQLTTTHAVSPPFQWERRPAISLGHMQKRITNSAFNSWATVSQDKNYHRHHFLSMLETKRTTIVPTYANRGSWIKFVGEVHLCVQGNP